LFGSSPSNIGVVIGLQIFKRPHVVGKFGPYLLFPRCAGWACKRKTLLCKKEEKN
jgi:hypothetical protein